MKVERIWDTLNLSYWESHSFDAEMHCLLGMMARHAAIAIASDNSTMAVRCQIYFEQYLAHSTAHQTLGLGNPALVRYIALN